MGLEREDFDELAAKRPSAGSDRKVLSGLAQAALKAEAVTSDQAWDTYLSYVQQAINVAKQQRAQYADALSSPKLVNPDQIAIVKNELLIRDTRINALEWTITMPAEIKRVGSVAKEKLAALDVQEANEETLDAA